MTSELTAAATSPETERAAWLRTTIVTTARVLLSAALADMAQGPSTGSAQDRLAQMALRPWLPKLEGVLLSKLSEADPQGLERLAGAIAWAIESVLAQAPGEPEPRYYIAWTAAGRPELVPAAGGEA